jgi:hypothetical protein
VFELAAQAGIGTASTISASVSAARSSASSRVAVASKPSAMAASTPSPSVVAENAVATGRRGRRSSDPPIIQAHHTQTVSRSPL